MESKLSDKELLEVAERVLSARKRQRLSQDQLADKSGITKQTISKIETASREMQAGTAKRLAESLDVSTDYILRGNICEEDFLIWYEKVKKLPMNISMCLFEAIEGFVRTYEQENKD